MTLLSLSPASALGQATNQITVINPNSAAQGTTNLLVTFTLDTDAPPAPPAGVMPLNVTIGSISGTSATHSSQYIVTARFNIPSGEPAGAKDATITFSTPSGTLVFSKAGGFTVTAGTSMPPSITQQPQSQTAATGGYVSFTVTASGTAPLSYQWQKNDIDIGDATGTSYAINPVALSDAGNYRCVVTNNYGSAASDEAVLTVIELPPDNYPVVDTGQVTCYNNTSQITCPQTGQAFYGQDSQHAGHQPGFTLSSDGLTVHDNITGLTWQHTPDTNGDGSIRATDKLTWTQAQARPAALNAAHYGGFSDWRLPTIKELYSLIDFRGTDPSGYTGTDTSWLTPFIDTDYFDFAYGDTSAGERIIDSQYASSTLYVSTAYEALLFGVNLADGRIKGYGLTAPGGGDKTFLVQCVRGGTHYAVNNLIDNGDGTVTDRSTSLMWSRTDSGTGLNWEGALAWVQTKNSQSYLGHNDWRLPNAKELQSIVDYTRSPDTTGSAAISPVFSCTAIINEGGQTDYPYYWTSTTHISTTGPGSYYGSFAVYVCFGRGLGYMGSAWVDVHGAGCQRSDPKIGDPNDYPTGHGPQGDAIRIYNYVRLVRDVAIVISGDLNCDGLIDHADVSAFVLALTDPTQYGDLYPSCDNMRADCNGDTVVDGRDIAAFVELLLGG
ncbi:MAG TPA: DUF1566 domain-containing protein [Phycisphaerae bacterium]|nr:DUF1566 domain-containing protein [Phycisphaerae bacterium]